MLKNYLKVALRHLRKQKGYAFINVFGLALGIACCLLMMLFVRHELSFDRFHANAERLYRAWGQEDWGEGRDFFYTITPIPLAPTLEASFPEVEETVRVDLFQDLVGPEDNTFTERVHMVDPAFFEVFSFPLREGEAATALNDPQSVVLTPDMAAKYFPGENPVGQALRIHVGGEPQDFTVTALAEAPPAASSIQFELVIPYENTRDFYSPGSFDNWFSITCETYVLLREDADAVALEAKFPAMSRQVLGDEAERVQHTVGLQPITDIHLNQDFPVGIEPTSDPAYAFLLGAIALFVLLIAAINFITLSLGQSTRRALEVGVRKVLGAPRRRLMQQFWGEAFLLVGLALLAGLALAQALLPFFNDLSGRDLSLALDPLTLLVLIALLVLVGFGAGSYPALVLSRFNPIEALKDKLQVRGDRSLLRRGLVVVQFTLAILMILGTLFVTRQLNFLQTKNLGFEKEQVVVLRTGVGPEQALPLIGRFLDAVSGQPAVAGVSASAFALDEGWAVIGYEAEDGSYRNVNFNWIAPDFLETVGVEMVAGRTFSPALATDSSKILVNETLVDAYGWGSPQEALGKQLPGSGFPPHEIIGVVQDFNFASLKNAVEPLVLALDPRLMLQGADDVNFSASSNRKLAVRLRPGDGRGAVDLLQETWTRVAGGLPFDYYFLDEAVDARYREEERLSRIVGTASLLAILIACLGLFGLATLTVARRTKEIGIRKVMGASAGQIVGLLSKDFAVLVLVAFAVAVPLAYLGAHVWLDAFAYRIDLGVGTFLLAGALALLVALLTVSVQALKAALADPVDALRYE